MPHVEIRHTENVQINTTDLFDAIETTINKLDASAGACKSRAYATRHYKHPHLMLDLWLLRKQHRDRIFIASLGKALKTAVRKHLPKDFFVSLQIHFRDENYITEENDLPF